MPALHDIPMSPYLPAVGLLALALTITAALSVLFSKNWGLLATLLWLVVIAAVPVAGSIVYLLVDSRIKKTHRAA